MQLKVVYEAYGGVFPLLFGPKPKQCELVEFGPNAREVFGPKTSFFTWQAVITRHIVDTVRHPRCVCRDRRLSILLDV